MTQRLVYYPDSRPGITRRRCGRGFTYIAADGTRIDDAAERARLKGLAVPPAYEQVWMSPIENGHLLATGYDSRSRKQYRYHPDWTSRRAARKYDRLAEFSETLPGLRRWITARLKGEVGDKETAVAAALALIDRGALRAGTPEYAEENDSYGATTLQRRHVSFDGAQITLDFTAKGGKAVTQTLHGRRLSQVLHDSADLPGAELLSWIDDHGAPHGVRSEHLNSVLAEVCGEGVTAKTLRTWHGTHAAFSLALDTDTLTIKAMSEAAAERLHNTPAIARTSYIHPRVIGLAERDAAARAKLAGDLAGERIAGLRSGEAELAAFLHK